MANNTGQKFGGRTAGTSNIKTAEIREAFSLLLENNIDKIQNDIDLLEPKERIRVLLDLATFIIPKMKSVELLQQEQEQKSIIIDMSKWK